MRIAYYWSDEDTVCAVRFDDGWTIAATEKGAVTINTEGVITGTWWKEEPTDEHWGHFMAECGTEETQSPLPISEEMDELIFRAGHYDGETAAKAARDLKVMVDWLAAWPPKAHQWPIS
jgi:hypothetical protein